MKCFNKHTFEKLGFDVVCTALASRALGREAKDRCLKLVPMSDPEILVPELKRVHEFKEVLSFDDPFPFRDLPDVSDFMDRISIEGNWLSAKELFTLLGWMKTVVDVRKYLISRKEKYPLLDALVNTPVFQSGMVKDIEKVLDERGEIRDNASTELNRIRKEMRSSANELRTSLNRILRKAKENSWDAGLEITLRNDRLVIPVKAEAKSRIPGFVQDVSSTGNTIFIEPAEALSLNNRLRELQITEYNEIVKILQALTAKVRESIDELREFGEVMVILDTLRARARLAMDLKAVLPVVNPAGMETRIVQGNFPLLLLKSLQEKINVIPLDVALEPESRILVISGPNAGGKSVSLKTVGLLQIMLQSGMLVPVDEKSEFRLYDSLFMDIGDEQSVESDLSTYTSHLYQLRLMGDHMTEKSLFLIDEFGSGTDPRLGGAIAEAFLQRFARLGAYGIITTHYSNIKEYAELTENISNAAMEFDTEGLKPTYRLKPGIPGRSYAFEIAKRVGVHHTILRNAKRKIGKKQISAEQLLRQLEEKSTELERVLAENKQRESRLSELVEKNEVLKKELDANKKHILREAQSEARQMIKDANRRIERTIREIKEKKAEKGATLELRKRLEASKPELLPELEGEIPAPKKKKRREKHVKTDTVKLLPDEIPVEGDDVKLKSSSSMGKLVEVQGKRGVVEVGQMRLTVKLNQLIKVSLPKTQQKVTFSGFQTKIVDTEMNLDVMGKRVEEALIEVEKRIDQALLAGLPFIRILHGKGSGALREAIRQYLKGIPAVRSCKDAPLNAGGEGWTIVELKE